MNRKNGFCAFIVHRESKSEYILNPISLIFTRIPNKI